MIRQGLLALILAGAAGSLAAAEITPRFVDVAAESGIETVTYCGGADKDHLLESVGTGAAFLDFDRDGLLDVYLVNGWLLDEEPSGARVRGQNALYRNLGEGRFEEVPGASGLGDDSWGCGVCTGDVDGDGWVDVYVTNFGPNRLYRNRGDGSFEEIAESAGVDDPGWGSGCAFLDGDGDGDLDLYVANYVDASMDDVLAASRTNRWRTRAKVMVGPFGLGGGRDRYYRNEGDGTFRDAAAEAGLVDEAEAYGMGVVASDLDLDGDVDVYVANDSNPNYLYENLGDGSFREVGGWSGAGFSGDGNAQAGMGVDSADFDGDGLPDLLVTNFARDTCTLYQNLGELFFDDISSAQQLRKFTYEELSWGCAFFDPDLDGDLDIVIANGHIYPQVDDFPDFDETYRQHPLLLANREGQLENVTSEAGPGFSNPIAGRGVAVGDYDDDGDPDILISAIDSPPLLLRNDTERRNHWVAIRLLTEGGAAALNARARVVAGGVVQTGEVRSGSTFQSQSTTDLGFGLGTATRIDSLEIRWPGGGRSVELDLPADRLHVRTQEVR